MNSDALTDLSDKVANIEAQNTKLQQDLVDLRARSMWCNLLFYNLPESEQEDQFTIIREVLSEKMGIDENGDRDRAGSPPWKKKRSWKTKGDCSKIPQIPRQGAHPEISPPNQRHKIFHCFTLFTKL